MNKVAVPVVVGKLASLAGMVVLPDAHAHGDSIDGNLRHSTVYLYIYIFAHLYALKLL